MTVLHLSTNDGGGGAARAAHRLHTGLRRLGHESTLLVLKRTGDDPSVRKMTWSDDWRVRLRRSRRRRQVDRDFAAYRPLPKAFEWYSDDRSEAGYDLVRQLPACDVVNLHWVGGFVDHELFWPHLPPGVPVVWRMADMAPLTGGCHYDLGCGKFAARCGACPVLGSTVEHDLSRAVWQRRHAAMAGVADDRLHLVGTSRWIAAESRRSSLLSRFPVTVIPNGLDATDFAPRDKGFARDTLGVPREAKVVLFVADTSDMVRKGFEYVVKALGGLTDRPDLFLLSVGFGKPAIPSTLRHRSVGRVSNDRMLSLVYSAADVFVIPSLQESFGQTVTESMACGTPVVGFDTGGIPDMVRPGVTGYLAKVGDADALRAELLRVLDLPPDQYAAMSATCRRVAVEEYTLDLQARRYAELYASLVAKSGRETSAVAG